MTPEEMAAALAKAEQDRDAAVEAAKVAKADADKSAEKVAELEKAATPAKPEPVVDDLAKADPAIRARLEKAEADAVAANTRLEKAEKIAKEEREIRITGEFIAKADEYKALPVKPADFGPVLKAASENLSADQYTALETVLKAADSQIQAGALFKEQGRSGDANPETSDDGLVAKAAELRKNDSTLSESDAMVRAMHDHPELAAGYLASIR